MYAHKNMKGSKDMVASFAPTKQLYDKNERMFASYRFIIRLVPIPVGVTRRSIVIHPFVVIILIRIV